MATTKYPLNGRPATLDDLVIDYAETSDWPTSITEDSSFEGWSFDDEQPFKRLVLNNLKANIDKVNPYEIVWFNDDIYSDTKYDYRNKRYRLILLSDTSIMGLTKEIKASDIANNDTITANGIEYRFIIPTKTTNNTNDYELNSYYVDYKCDNGQATVLYTLLEIIDILQDETKIYKYFFGDKESENDPNSAYTGSYNITFNSEDILVPSLFDASVNPEDIIQKDTFGTTSYIINPRSYDTLGNYFWTLTHVQYNNYTNSNAGKDLLTCNRPTYQDPSILKMALDYIILENIPIEDGEYSDLHYRNVQYNTATKQAQIYFYTLIFLRTLRHFRSFITSCKFVHISDIIYQRNQAILRCDISLLGFIEKITIVSALHLPSTALSAGPLSLSTKISINIVYSLKYRNITQETIASFILDRTIQQIKSITENEVTTISQNLQLYRLAFPGYITPTNNNDYMTDNIFSPIDNTKNIKYGDIDTCNNLWYIGTDTSTSTLGTLKWPLYDDSLELPDEETFNNAKDNYQFTYKNKPSYVDTNALTDNKYGTSDPEGIKTFLVNNKLTLFGVIKIHNTYINSDNYNNTDTTDELKQEIVNSSYFIEVPLLRFKNYYYTTIYNGQSNSNLSDDSRISLYFEPLYDVNNNIITPNTLIDSSVIKGDINTNITPANLTTLTGGITLPKQVDNDELPIYLTLYAPTGTITYFASGDYDTAANSYEYINTPLLTLEYYDTSVNSWKSSTAYSILSALNLSTDSQVLTACYRLFMNNDETAEYYRIKSSAAYNYYYFKSNNYNKSSGQNINIHYIVPDETEESNISFIIYGDKANNTNLQYIQLFNNYQIDISVDAILSDYYNYTSASNIYFKLTSLKYKNRNAVVDTKYLYTVNYSKLYYAYSHDNTYTVNNGNVFAIQGLAERVNTDTQIKLFISFYPIVIIKIVQGNTNISLNKFYYRLSETYGGGIYYINSYTYKNKTGTTLLYVCTYPAELNGLIMINTECINNSQGNNISIKTESNEDINGVYTTANIINISVLA